VITAACLPPIIWVDIFFAIVCTVIFLRYAGHGHVVMEVITVRTENQITRARNEFVLWRIGSRRRLVWVCACVVFRDFSAKFREKISEVGKL